MRVLIRGLATAEATPILSQAALAEGAVPCCCRTDRERKLLPKLYQRTQVERRGCCVASNGPGLTEVQRIQAFFRSATGPEDRGPGTAERVNAAVAAARTLAVEAGEAVLADAGVVAEQIDHLVCASCTGFAAPGVSLHLLDTLRLPPTVSRTDVGFMGCHGALNALRAGSAMAAQTATTRGIGRALVVASEVCSAHFQYGFDPAQVVANALFADGAAAVLLEAMPGPHPADGVEDGSASTNALPEAIELADQVSLVLPETAEHMHWHIGDHGFEMYLSAKVPDIVAEALPAHLDDWLATRDLNRSAIGGWCIHPGGPRIVEAVVGALDLPHEAGDHSRAVLHQRGNMSSPTVLYIAEAMRRSGVPRPWVVLALGPGLTAEVALLR